MKCSAPICSPSTESSQPAISPARSAPDCVALLGQEAQEKYRNQANIIAEVFPGVVLSTVSGTLFGGVVSPGGFKAYLDRLLHDAGNPADPMEGMLMQQLTWVHHHVGILMAKAASAANPQEIEVYNQALSRLMSEFRRGVLALREYRSAPAPKQLTVVKQQNVANGNQNVAMVQGSAAEKIADTELGSNQARLDHVELRDAFPTADCRPAEPVEAARSDCRRA